MILTVKNHPYRYEMETLCRVFFPFEKIRSEALPEAAEPIVVNSVTQTQGDTIVLCVDVQVFDRKTCKQAHIPLAEAERDYKVCQWALAVLLYQALGELLDYYPKWGVLTGVRTAKVMRRVLEEQQGSPERAKAYFVEQLLVSEEKADLALETALFQERAIKLSRPESFSLYISIPFCPTRCSYCSFVSHSMKSAGKLIEPYVALLAQELEETAVIAKELGLRLETIYFGGGTPTTLEAPQLSFLIDTIRQNFDLSHLQEFTVEAGRPDTITREKLEALRQGGVGRISINPQSFHNRVLQAIGRNHTAQQTVDAFYLARDVGFDNINMDFIAGLPEDTMESFRRSIQTALDLGADSVTVHTLAMKRASYLVMKDLQKEKQDADMVNKMVSESAAALRQGGYTPYYMYRQSKTAGNLENVGWSRPGKDCLYNIYMMDETHTVLACGAGAVTMLKAPLKDHIARVYNYKYPFEYNSDFQEMIKRKDRIKSFYEEYPLER